jgi:hypothetical protein
MTIATQRIRVQLPGHLRPLARLEPGGSGEIAVPVEEAVTMQAVLDAVEEFYPMLRGTLRDHATGALRPFLRYFACGRDISRDPVGEPLPACIASGDEALVIEGAAATG